MASSNVIDSRVFWDHLVTSTIHKYEYSAISYEQFVKRMSYLGFNPKDIVDIFEEYEDVT